MNSAWALGQISVETPPSELIMPIADVRHHLHIDAPDDDPVLERMLRAATDRFDGPHGVGWALQRQRWQWVLSDWPCYYELPPRTGTLRYYADSYNAFALPGHPVRSLVSVKYLTDDTTFTDLTGMTLVDSAAPEEPSIIWSREGYPELGTERPYGIKIVYELGGLPIPDELQLGILMTVGQWYQAREGMMEPMAQIPAGAMRIMSRYRNMVGRFG